MNEGIGRLFRCWRQVILSMLRQDKPPSIWIYLSLLGLALSAGCSLGSAGVTPTAAPKADYQGLAQVPFDQFVTQFDLRFEGDPGWQYQLTTRRSGEIVERQLQVEGVDDTRAPGDVRMVTNDGVTRMRGEGTEGRCLQFPEDMSVNITLLSPDDILPPEDFIQPLTLLGQEEVAGFDTDHYVLQQAELDGWQQVQVGLWFSKVGGAVVKHELEASGWDPYFGAGWGQMRGTFQLVEIGQQSIDPVEGCQVELPLPDSVMNLVVLPEIVAFGSQQSLEELAEFYQMQLDQAGWRSLNQEERTSGAVVLHYFRETERLQVTIRRFNEVTQVELLKE